VRVRDTGAGLSADALPHIFELFAQATADGLGLLSRLGPIGWSLDPHAAPPHDDGSGCCGRRRGESSRVSGAPDGTFGVVSADSAEAGSGGQDSERRNITIV
jgi:hypothetical protein